MPKGIPGSGKSKKKKTDKPQENGIQKATPTALEGEIVDPEDEFKKPDDEPGLSLGFGDEGKDHPIRRILANPLLATLIMCIGIPYIIIGVFGVYEAQYKRDVTRLELDLVDVRDAKTAQDSQMVELENSQQSTNTAITNLQNTTVKESDMSAYATKASLDVYVTNGSLADYATKTDLDDYATDNALDSFNDDIDERLVSFEESMTGLSDRVTDSSEDISTLDNLLDNVDVRTGVLISRVDDLDTAMGNVTSHLWFTLMGDDGEYDLDVGSRDGGTYMGRMTLLYDPPVVLTGNITGYCEALAYFYDMLDEPNRSYIPTTAWNGVTWELVQIEVYTSAFTLSAEQEVSFSIMLDGLGNLPQHSAFIEVINGASAPEGGGGSI